MVFLRVSGHVVNRKRVQRLMRSMGPGPNTSRAHPKHKVSPYLQRGVPVTRPNQVWSTDITYIRLAREAWMGAGGPWTTFSLSACGVT